MASAPMTKSPCPGTALTSAILQFRLVCFSWTQISLLYSPPGTLSMEAGPGHYMPPKQVPAFAPLWASGPWLPLWAMGPWPWHLGFFTWSLGYCTLTLPLSRLTSPFTGLSLPMPVSPGYRLTCPCSRALCSLPQFSCSQDPCYSPSAMSSSPCDIQG